MLEYQGSKDTFLDINAKILELYQFL